VTRLKTEDILHISAGLVLYDRELMDKTGCTLGGIACRAAGVDPAEIQKIAGANLVGVIPFTGGEGIISEFCEAVKSIVSHLGCRAFVTRASDVTGLAEAFDKKADIVLLADDKRFVALHLHRRRVIDNADATGKGFAAGLGLMAGGIEKKKVLVLGCGSVGRAAVEALARAGARPSVYDINFSRAEALRRSLHAEIQIEKDLEAALAGHRYMVDCTPAEDIIAAHHITADTYISAPGVPIGLDREARQKIGLRLLHDPLQIGVATMVVFAMKNQLNSLMTSPWQP
jgi:pyrrolysine biosynthesis protein PylD